YNAFKGQIVVELNGERKLLADEHLICWRFDVRRKFGFLPPKELFEEVLYDTAYRNRFNPVRDFLNAARPQWDGKRRIGKWLATYFGAADTTLNRRIGL